MNLQRIAKSLIADKIKMFGLFSRILDRSMKAKDSDLMTYVQEASSGGDSLLDPNDVGRA